MICVAYCSWFVHITCTNWLRTTLLSVIQETSKEKWRVWHILFIIGNFLLNLSMFSSLPCNRIIIFMSFCLALPLGCCLLFFTNIFEISLAISIHCFKFRDMPRILFLALPLSVYTCVYSCACLHCILGTMELTVRTYLHKLQALEVTVMPLLPWQSEEGKLLGPLGIYGQQGRGGHGNNNEGKPKKAVHVHRQAASGHARYCFWHIRHSHKVRTPRTS